jgi:pimeloyl-ACP methyl ester carboxylesterase
LMSNKALVIRIERAVLATTFAIASCGGPRSSTEEAPSDSASIASAEVRVNNDGVFIDHKSCGEAEVTLLFVHGWAIDQTYWSSQVEAFCPEYRVVTMDLPGHGNSGTNRDRWTVEAYASDVRAVIDQLELDHVILIGHSMAGDIILEAAIDNENVMALVGVDNFKEVGTTYTDEVKAQIAGFLDELRTNFDAAAVAYSESYLFQPTSDSAVVRRVIRNILDVDSAIAVSTLQELFAYAPGEPDRLSMLDKPLYLINSSATPTDSAGLKSTGVAFEVLDAGPTGHYPMVEDPARFNQLLQQVVKQIEAGSDNPGVTARNQAGISRTTASPRPETRGGIMKMLRIEYA